MLKPSHSPGSFRRTSFALHYFPSIPLEGHPCGQAAADQPPENFQRVALGREEGARAASKTPGREGDPGDQVISRSSAGERMQAEIAAAFRQGFSEGERAGQAAARSESEAVLQQFSAAMEQFDALAESLRKDAERKVVSLSLAVARKMVGHALTTRPEALTGLIKEALKQVADHGRIRIRVHPDHLARVQQALPSFGDVVSKLERLSVEPDVAVNQGCVLETDFGELDACLETQFQVVEDLFREIDT